jgi:hypothetical protein
MVIISLHGVVALVRKINRGARAAQGGRLHLPENHTFLTENKMIQSGCEMPGDITIRERQGSYWR